MSIFNLFSLLGGLALFLFGMDTMSKALEKQAGNSLSRILEKLTSSPIKGFFLGLIVTAIIQSSSATTVMVVGFVNSGVMSLKQAVGIIFGSNVGTTVTAWILSLAGLQGDNFIITLMKPSTFSPVLAFIGIGLYMLSKKDKKKNIGVIFLGFAILMTGMDGMAAAVKPLKDVPAFTNMFIAFQNPVIGVVVGALLTAAIQSSSASVGILQALSTTGAVTCGSALPIIMGQNIGTCITAVLSAIGANKNAKRAAAVHLYFNIIGTTIFLVGFYSLNAVFQFSFISDSITAAGIAVIHTLFNIVATVIMLPFVSLLEKLAYATIKDDDDTSNETMPMIDTRLMATPSVAMDRTHHLIKEMSGYAFGGVTDSLKLFDEYNEETFDDIRQREKIVDTYEDKLGSFLVLLSAQSLSEQDNFETSRMLHVLGDLERLSDHSVGVINVAKEMVEKEIKFSDIADKEIKILKTAILDIVSRTQMAFEQDNKTLAYTVEPLERVIDKIIREIKSNHIQRLKNQECTIELGFALSDLLTNCERISDHCSNVAITVIDAYDEAFTPHESLRNYRKDENSDFAKLYDLEKMKYHL